MSFLCLPTSSAAAGSVVQVANGKGSLHLTAICAEHLFAVAALLSGCLDVEHKREITPVGAMRQARLALEAYRPSRGVDKVLGARQGLFAASVSRRKGSCACSGGCPLFSRLNTSEAAAPAIRLGLMPAYLRQEQEPLDAFRLHSDTCLCEESLNELETRNKRYCKAMTLKLPRSDIESDLEETQGLLLFQQSDLDEERSSRFLRVWFAAESEKQHLSWQSEPAFQL